MSNISMRHKVLGTMLLAGVVPMLIVSIVIQRNASTVVKELTLSGLAATTATKSAHIEDYFNLIREQSAGLSKDPTIVTAMRELTNGFLTLEAAEVQQADAKRVIKLAVN